MHRCSPRRTLQASLDAPPGGDASSALQALGSPFSGPGLLFVPPRSFDVRRSVDVNKPLVLPRGALLEVASGATLSINQPLNAGPWQLFSGSGAVKFKAGSALRILPEWFGKKLLHVVVSRLAFHYLEFGASAGPQPACLLACHPAGCPLAAMHVQASDACTPASWSTANVRCACMS